jgi:DNA mismatch repair protein MutS
VGLLADNKLCIICDAPYQVYNILNYVCHQNEFEKDEIDLLVCDRDISDKQIQQLKNLELFKSMGDHGHRGTLLWLLDKTQTPMGARQLKSWLERPLRRKEDIENRLDAVEEFSADYALREDFPFVP